MSGVDLPRPGWDALPSCLDVPPSGILMGCFVKTFCIREEVSPRYFPGTVGQELSSRGGISRSVKFRGEGG